MYTLTVYYTRKIKLMFGGIGSITRCTPITRFAYNLYNSQYCCKIEYCKVREDILSKPEF